MRRPAPAARPRKPMPAPKPMPAQPPMLKRAAPAKATGLTRSGLPGFELEALLHRGQGVEVWRARSTSGERVAVKTASSGTGSHPGIGAWLEREHAILAALSHPCIVRTVACGQGAALVMEYLGGGDLVPLAGTPAAGWLGAAAGLVAALEHVHARGFVHGDVKARNVLFAETREAEGPAKLADFGSALPIGAPHPEPWGTAAHRPLRFRMLRAAPEEDVYATAVLLYELLSGRLPFGRDPLAAAEPDWPLRSASDGSRRSSRRPRFNDAHLEPLAKRVMATLQASAPAEVGTLSEFADVIESVRMPLEAAGYPALNIVPAESVDTVYACGASSLDRQAKS
ncbi:MAG TPA: protein kinase [Gammaproteobacteria bacterium]|nr:protein kinase [Gammaproteobacteria bacterium]